MIEKIHSPSMRRDLDKDQIPQISEDFIKPGLLINFFKPNIQFIRHAKQLSSRANELVEIFIKLRDSLKINDPQSISTRTGAGFFINTESYNSKNFNRDFIIEIIDFDPVRNNLMVIGNAPPASDAVLHWFIYRGLPWINGIININDSEIFKRFSSCSYPVVEDNKNILNTELALNILKCIKTSEISLLKWQGILIVGKTISETYDIFKKDLEKLSNKKTKTQLGVKHEN